MKVKDLMSRDICSCSPETNLAEVASLMWQYDCGAIPVIDQNDKVANIITDRDICMAVALQNRMPAEIHAGEVASRGIYYCRETDNIQDALEVMAQQQVRRLPVVDDNDELLGMLSLNDVILNAESRRKKDNVTYADVMKAVKAISLHKHVNVSPNGIEADEALVAN
jgi:CBS domain-containing protein